VKIRVLFRRGATRPVLTPAGWTKIKVIWELSVKAIDKDSCQLTNRVMGSSTPEFLHYLAKSGIPFESAKQSLAVSAPAHNAQETPFFAASIEKKALGAKTAAGK
jgi:hypothetical protein